LETDWQPAVKPVIFYIYRTKTHPQKQLRRTYRERERGREGERGGGGLTEKKRGKSCRVSRQTWGDNTFTETGEKQLVPENGKANW